MDINIAWIKECYEDLRLVFFVAKTCWSAGRLPKSQTNIGGDEPENKWN